MAWWDRIGNGRMVTRATVVLVADTTDIFTITGGRILLTKIVGNVTTLVGGAANVYLAVDPLLGSAAAYNLCAPLNIDGYDIGNLLGITGVPTDAMVPPVAGGAIVAPTMEIIIPVGTIDFVSDLAPAGAVQWEVWFKPLDDGASVVAA